MGGSSGLGQLDENATSGRRVEKRDALSLGTDARRPIDEPETGVMAAPERSVEVVNDETDVVNSRSTFGDELPDRRFWHGRLEQLDERVASGEPGDTSPIGVLERNDGHAEDVAVKRQELIQAVNGDADVRDPRAAKGGFLQEMVGRRRQIRAVRQGTLRSAGG